MHDTVAISRRVLLRLAALLPLGLVPTRLLAAVRTPRATAGPFYPTPAMRFADADNDLVRIEGAVREAGGEVVVLKGRVLDLNASPVAGARVEIWQCDVNGRYLHSGDQRSVPRDAAFQGFGHVVTGPDGGYAFRTIKPVPYPGRTPHIHMKVLYGDKELITQLYIEGHPQNESDRIFRRLSEQEKRLVSMAFANGPNGPEAAVDIVI